jgi:hypothetical protein
MPERFVSEVIRPVVATCDTSRMAVGEPGLPREFLCRDGTIKIAAVLHTLSETGKCRYGISEVYVLKHWLEVVTTANSRMKIHFDRRPCGGCKSHRW